MTQRDIQDALSKYMVGTREHWIARGISPRQLRTLVSSGFLVRLRHGSYATEKAMRWAGEDPRRVHVLHVYAAMGAAGRDAVASFESAAIMHDIALFRHPGTVTLTLPSGRWRGPRAGGVITHTAELPRIHLDRMFRVPVTSPARTVADLVRTLPFMEAVVAADSAMHKQLTTEPEVAGALEFCASWPGMEQAKRVAAFASPNAESVLESCARVILARHFTETPEVQYSIQGPGYRYTADLYYKEHNTIIELDGAAKYQAKKDLLRQFGRDRELRDAGYKIVHVTWDELFKTPRLVVERIRRAFAAPSPY